jgi:Domain of unknown function (DUF1707)
MAGRGDETAAAADRGCLRASHADREQAIDLLKAAFVQGRLTESELDARVGQALASRTQAELATLTADLPAGLIAAPTRRKPARARPQLPGRKVAAGAGLTIPPAALMAVAFLSNNEHLSEACFLVIPGSLSPGSLRGRRCSPSGTTSVLPGRCRHRSLSTAGNWKASRTTGLAVIWSRANLSAVSVPATGPVLGSSSGPSGRCRSASPGVGLRACRSRPD